jgi:hypothetical protein
LSTTNSTWIYPGLRDERPATNRLSHCTAFKKEYSEMTIERCCEGQNVSSILNEEVTWHYVETICFHSVKINSRHNKSDTNGNGGESTNVNYICCSTWSPEQPPLELYCSLQLESSV